MRSKFKFKNVLMILLCSFFILASEKYGAKAEEIKTLKPNTNVTASVGDNSVWYSYVAKSNGYFTYSVNHNNIQESGTFTAVLKDADGKELYSQNGEKIDSKVWPCTAGTRYYIVVGGYDSARGKSYNLIVNEKAAKNWEREENGSQAEATQINWNKTIKGVISGSSDSDWYKIKVKKAGKFYINLKHQDISETGNYHVKMYLSDGTEIYDGTGSNIESHFMGYEVGTEIYICVSNNNNSEYSIYNLTTHYFGNRFFESENNGNESNAKNLKMGKTYQGLIASRNDQYDFYKFTLKNNCLVRLKFGPSDISDTGDWNVYIVDKNGKEYKLAKTSTAINEEFYLQKGQYYVRISNSYGAENKLYSLYVSAKKNNNISVVPKIKSVSYSFSSSWLTNNYVNTNINSIRLSKVSKGTQMYEYRISSEKSMKNSKILVSGDAKLDGKVLDGLSKTVDYQNKKQYYVQVRAYIEDVFGNRWYGKYSDVVKTGIKY